jgi:dihydroflavonol-4-reductase
MTTVFVTGGNGFIGSALVRALVGRGHTVRCLLRPTSNVRRIDGLPWVRVDGDVRQIDSLQRGMAGCDAVFHLASLSAWKLIDSPLMQEVVVQGTRNVLSAAQAVGGPKVVFVSSVAAVNGSEKPEVFDESAAWTLPVKGLTYSNAKRAAEARCQESARKGLPVVIVNPAEVYGPGDDDLVTAGTLLGFCRGNPVLVCEGGTSVVHVDDVVEGILRAWEVGRPGERYILGGENLSVRELARLTLELAGLSKRIRTVPRWLVRAVARVGLWLRLPLPFEPRVIPYATRYWFVDAGKAQRELGVRFRPARETLAPVVGWLKKTGRL